MIWATFQIPLIGLIALDWFRAHSLNFSFCLNSRDCTTLTPVRGSFVGGRM